LKFYFIPTFNTFKYSGVAHFLKQTLLNNNGNQPQLFNIEQFHNSSTISRKPENIQGQQNIFQGSGT